MKYLVGLLNFIKHANIDILLYAVALYFAVRGAEHSTKTYILLAVITLCLLLWVIAHIQLSNAFSVMPKAKQLVTSGLYRYIRHPIYAFTLVTNIAIICLINIPWLYLLIPFMIALQLYRAHKESQILEKTFGDAYRTYRKHTWI